MKVPFRERGNPSKTRTPVPGMRRVMRCLKQGRPIVDETVGGLIVEEVSAADSGRLHHRKVGPEPDQGPRRSLQPEHEDGKRMTLDGRIIADSYGRPLDGAISKGAGEIFQILTRPLSDRGHGCGPECCEENKCR
jgi:hypothetical protein